MRGLTQLLLVEPKFKFRSVCVMPELDSDH